MLDFTGVEDREGHQAPVRLHGQRTHRPLARDQWSEWRRSAWAPGADACPVEACRRGHGAADPVRAGRRVCLQDPARRARGHGRAASTGHAGADLLVGLDDGDDAAVVRVADGLAVISTADFFTPVVDDAYDWGRIVAANALSDVYAMGGDRVLAINLVGWPRARAAARAARARCSAAGSTSRALAGCPVAGGHSIDDPEPKYGMAVTGVADPDRLLRNDAARAGSAAHA